MDRMTLSPKILLPSFMLIWCTFGLCAAATAAGCSEIERTGKDVQMWCEGAGWWMLHQMLASRIIASDCAAAKVVDDTVSSKSRSLQTTACTVGQTVLEVHQARLDCIARSSPFQSGSLIVKFSSGQTNDCKLHASIVRSPIRLLAFWCGIILFIVAGGLASHAFFRIGLGTALFTVTGSLLITVWLARRATQMNSIALLSIFMVFLSSLMGFSRTIIPARIKWALGNEAWISYFVAYTSVMAIIGWMLCYLHDDPSNTRRNTVFVVAARILASASIWLSVSHEQAGLVLVSILWIGHLGPNLASIKGAMYIKGMSKSQRIKREDNFRDLMINRTHKRNVVQGYNGNLPDIPIEKWCMLCKSGSIVNRRTNRNIRIGGGTFQQLVEEGAAPDFKHGYI